MKCLRCQQENAPSQKFCGECGARYAAVCTSCGASNPPAQKFCGECGASLTQGVSAAAARPPESYTPKHLAEKILKGSMELLASVHRGEHPDARGITYSERVNVMTGVR